MLRKTFALTVRSLRADARRSQLHLFRAGMCIVILLNLLISQATPWSQATGLDLFSWLMIVNAGFATLGAPLLFASAITEEKEEQTLGLLRVADVGALSLVSGKTIPRLISVLLVLIVQFPFTLLAITLGGVTFPQILAAYFALGAYVLAVGCLSVLCSVVCRTTGNAVGLTGLVLIGYHLIPFLFHALATAFVNDPEWGRIATAVVSVTDWILPANVFHRLTTILQTGFAGGPWSYQVTVNLLAAMVFFLIAWRTFELFNRDVEAPARQVWTPFPSRRFNRPRPWQSAVMWKEFQYTAGGMRLIYAKLIVYLALFGVVIGTVSNWTLSQLEVVSAAWFIAGLTFYCVIPIEITLTVARLVHPEIKGQTLSSLFLLPYSTRQIMYSKLAGGLLGVLPAVGFLILSLLVALGSSNISPSRPFNIVNLDWSAVGQTVATLALAVGQVLLFWHLVLLLSVYINPWAAIGLAIFSLYCAGTIVMVPFGFLLFMLTGASSGLPAGVLAVLTIAFGTIFTLAPVAGLHFLIGRQIERKAAQ